MKKIVDDIRTILRICDLYYNQDMKQSEIARELNISRPTISRMISTAKEKGLVKIVISDLHGRNYFELERKLEEKYKLKNVIIVDTLEDENEQKDEIGRAAAEYLERIIRDGDVVGVSMGTTLNRMARFVETTVYYRKLLFVPLLGGVGQIETELHSNHIAESMAKSFGGRGIQFHAPAVVSRKETKTILLEEDSVKSVFKKIENLNVAVVGIGTIRSGSTIIKAGYYSMQTLQNMKEGGAVGDICMRFFGDDGEPLKNTVNENVIGINLSKLRTVPYSIGVAAGVYKKEAIKAALTGRLINVLITDEECAAAIYREE